jgi:hypothetical protein
MAEKPERKKSIEEKYPPMSPEDIRKEEQTIERGKAKYSMLMADVEKALSEFLDQVDPIDWKGKAIAWVRRPSMKELKALIPPEMAKYMDNPKAVPEEMTKRYEGHFYTKMAELIKIPKKTAEQWEATANPWFMRLFWEHIADIAKLMEGQVEGF